MGDSLLRQKKNEASTKSGVHKFTKPQNFVWLGTPISPLEKKVGTSNGLAATRGLAPVPKFVLYIPEFCPRGWRGKLEWETEALFCERISTVA